MRGAIRLVMPSHRGPKSGIITGMEVLDFSGEWLQSYPDFHSELSLEGHKSMLVPRVMYAYGRSQQRRSLRTL